MEDNVVYDPAAGGNSSDPSIPADQQNIEGTQQVPDQNAETPQVVENASADPVEGQTDEQPMEEAVTTEEVSDAPPPKMGGGIIKKIIIGLVALVIIVFLIFLFIPKGNSNKKVKLVWWGLWEDSRVMQPIIADFQKANPNITVEYVKQDHKQYRDRLLTRINNGNGPDIFRFHNTWVPMISDSLLALPTDVVTPNELKTDFYPVIQKDMNRNGAIYGIPIGVDTLSLFVNTELLESAGVTPPKTWDEFVNVASKLTVKDPETKRVVTAGAALGTYGNVTHASDILALLFIQQGVNMNKFSDQPKEKKIAVLNFYTSFAKGDQKVWDASLDESILSFSKGSLAMYIGYSWDVFRIQAMNKDLKFKTYPVPQLVGRNSTLASYWAEGVSAKSVNQKEALMFMRHLKKKETQQKFYTEVSKTRGFGEPYARSDLAKSIKDDDIVSPFVAQMETASSSYFASNTNDGEGGLNSMLSTYLGDSINAIINDNSSADTVVDTLNQGVAQTYQKYGIQ